MWSKDAKNQQSGSDDDEDEDEDDSEESSEDEAGGPSKSAAAQELSREERKNQKKARKEAAIAKAKAAAVQVGDLPPSDSEDESEDDMPANPNHSKAARKQAIAPVKKADDVDEVAEGVAKISVSKQPQSRKERESAEAALAKERYMKMHLAGKTDEAKADMARLAEIRAKREADKARREVCSSGSGFCVHRHQLTHFHFYNIRPKRKNVRRRRPSSGLRSRRRRRRSVRLPWASPLLPRRVVRVRSRARTD